VSRISVQNEAGDGGGKERITENTGEKERAQGEDLFLGMVTGVSRVRILLEAGSRMPMRRKRWPEGRFPGE
jgi:hypothetical protein